MAVATADLAWKMLTLPWTLLTNPFYPEVEEVGQGYRQGYRRDCRRQSRSLLRVSVFFARFPFASPLHPHCRVQVHLQK